MNEVNYHAEMFEVFFLSVNQTITSTKKIILRTSDSYTAYPGSNAETHRQYTVLAMHWSIIYTQRGNTNTSLSVRQLKKNMPCSQTSEYFFLFFLLLFSSSSRFPLFHVSYLSPEGFYLSFRQTELDGHYNGSVYLCSFNSSFVVYTCARNFLVEFLPGENLTTNENNNK